LAKVLLLNGPSIGHIKPTLPLVKELVETQEEVHYCAPFPYRALIEETGAKFHPYLVKDPGKNPFVNYQIFNLIEFLLESHFNLIPFIKELGKRENFDYIIHDSMYGCGAVASQVLDLPNISSCSCLINIEEKISTYDYNHTSAVKSVLDKKVGLDNYLKLSRKISEVFSVPRLTIKDILFNKGELNLIYSDQSLQPSYELLDDSFVFVGPAIKKEDTDDTMLMGRLFKKPLIYISMGTIFNQVEFLYDICMTALSSFAGEVIISAGNAIDMFKNKDIPKNFTVRKHVQQLKVLEQADIFITHGGFNSVNEALYCNVPLIVIPLAADQPIVAKQVEMLGVGINLSPNELTSSLLRNKVNHVLSSASIKSNCYQLSNKLKSATRNKIAFKAIEQFKIKMNIN